MPRASAPRPGWPPPPRARRLMALAGVILAAGACGSSGGAGQADGANDSAREASIPSCPAIDGDDAAAPAEGDAGAPGAAVDEFGPHATIAKAASSLGRVNVYEATSARLLTRLDIYLRVDLDQTRLTIGVFEAAARGSAFQKIAALPIEAPAGGGPCQGWVTTGPLAIPLEAGRFYMTGYDPSQPVTPFVTTDADTLPVDGAFGRLIGSKTTTSVSVSTIGWDKLSDKEYNRQRLVTSPRDAASPADGGDADAADAAATDAGEGDARDAARDGPRG